MHLPKISVIVPVYNAQNTLPRCIESIVSQSNYINDFEVVFVDDGSSDASPRILDEYALSQRNFKVIHQDNGGVLKARKTGVANVKAEWIYFMDADDEIKPETLFRMSRFIADDVDMIIFETSLEGNIDTETYIRHLFRGQSWPLWGKLIRRSLLDDYVMSVPREISSGEDFIAQLRLLSKLRGGIIASKESYYIYDPHSLTSVRKTTPRTYEYERRMIELAAESLSRQNISEALASAFYMWKLSYVAGMIGLMYKVDYCDSLICSVRTEGFERWNSLNFKAKLCIKAIGCPLYRCFFIAEKQSRRIARSLLAIIQ